MDVITEPIKRKILIVDDEPAIRDVLGRMIRRINFEPLCAENGAEALELFGAHQSEIDLAIIDYTMPGMDGTEVLRRIRALRGDIIVIFSSGLSEADIRGVQEEASKEGFAPNAFLQKPFRLSEFQKTLQDVMGNGV